MQDNMNTVTIDHHHPSYETKCMLGWHCGCPWKPADTLLSVAIQYYHAKWYKTNFRLQCTYYIALMSMSSDKLLKSYIVKNSSRCHTPSTKRMIRLKSTENFRVPRWEAIPFVEPHVLHKHWSSTLNAKTNFNRQDTWFFFFHCSKHSFRTFLLATWAWSYFFFPITIGTLSPRAQK